MQRDRTSMVPHGFCDSCKRVCDGTASPCGLPRSRSAPPFVAAPHVVAPGERGLLTHNELHFKGIITYTSGQTLIMGYGELRSEVVRLLGPDRFNPRALGNS